MPKGRKEIPELEKLVQVGTDTFLLDIKYAPS